MRDKNLYEKSKRIFAHWNGSGLASKYADHYSPNYPSYFKSNKGCVITDIDNNKWIDFGTMGYSVLGYNNPYVKTRIQKAIEFGPISSLNNKEEVELAELLMSETKFNSSVKFGLSGADGIDMAIRLARAYTGKSKVMFNGYHGHSDAYLSANLENNTNLDHFRKGLKIEGVPKELKGTATVIRHNNFEDLHNIDEHTACIVLEPIRYEKPLPVWVNAINIYKNRYNFVLIMDEVTTGFRFSYNNMSDFFGFDYDMIVYSKSISSGYPFSVVIGKRDIMEMDNNTFLSSTNWSSMIGNVATLATLKELKRSKDKYVERDLNTMKIRNTVSKYFPIDGMLGLWKINFNSDLIRKKYIEIMLKNGFLQTGVFYPSFDQGKYVDRYIKVFNEFTKGAK